MAEDRFGNPHAPGLPYAHGEFIRDSRDDHAKLRHAWRFIEARVADSGLDGIYNLSGLERRFEAPDDGLTPLDDELAPALMGKRLNKLALDHLGGDAKTHGIMVFNRQTAAIMTATRVLAGPGQTVIGVSATGSNTNIFTSASNSAANLALVVKDLQAAIIANDPEFTADQVRLRASNVEVNTGTTFAALLDTLVLKSKAKVALAFSDKAFAKGYVIAKKK